MSPRSKAGMGPNAAWEAGMSFVAGPVMGYYLDEWLDTSPWFFFGCTILGAAAGFRRLFSLLPATPDPPEDQLEDDNGDDGASS